MHATTLLYCSVPRNMARYNNICSGARLLPRWLKDKKLVYEVHGQAKKFTERIYMSALWNKGKGQRDNWKIQLYSQFLNQLDARTIWFYIQSVLSGQARHCAIWTLIKKSDPLIHVEKVTHKWPTKTASARYTKFPKSDPHPWVTFGGLSTSALVTKASNTITRLSTLVYIICIFHVFPCLNVFFILKGSRTIFSHPQKDSWQEELPNERSVERCTIWARGRAPSHKLHFSCQ